MAEPQTYDIEPFDPEAAPEEHLLAHYDLDQELHAEFWSEDPVTPYEQWKKELLQTPSWRKTLRWTTWGDDRARVLGASTLSLGYTESNRHIASIDVSVRKDARRRHLASTLLRPVVEAAEADGRTLLGAGAPTDTPGAAFLDALGADRKIVERKSRMVLAEVDRSMLEEWVERAADRAAGYSLLAWDGPVPEEYLDRFVALAMVMNTAPRDDLDMEDWVHTAARQRENEERAARQDYSWWTLVAREDATDQLAGYTEFFFSPHQPNVAWQEATAVDPVHRDKGLGRWLKAANCLRLMDERPEAAYVDTWNAFSNAPMLGINIAMGFQVVKSYSDYQIPTDRLAAALKERVGG